MLYIRISCIVCIFDLNVIHTTLHSVSENHHRNYGIHILKGFSRITCKLYVYGRQNPLYIHPYILHNTRSTSKYSNHVWYGAYPYPLWHVRRTAKFCTHLLCYIQSLSTMKHGEMCLFGKLWLNNNIWDLFNILL